MKNYRWILVLLIGFIACNDNASDESKDLTNENVSCGTFNEDSAYMYIQKQVDFGPRIPGTPAQKLCAQWLESELRKSCDTVYVQNTTVIVENNIKKPCINIIGSINPQIGKRILLVAHWDTRPWADKEDKAKQLDGADDGGSGVAVLLELAKVIGHSLPNIGIDFLLTDVEDLGDKEENSYCKGTQYWAQHPHIPNYTAKYGILLDMVGGKGSQFKFEQISMQYAPNVENNVWTTAESLGFQQYFLMQMGLGVTDDHVYINQIRGIPTIDIIGTVGEDFPPHHHTTKDNMSIIDKPTLKAVGQTVMQVLCNENANEEA